MSIVNRRNALIGWATWSVGKNLAKIHIAKKKAKGVIPSRERGGSKKKAVKVIAVVATVAGAAAFWKARHGDSTDHDSVASEEISVPEE